MADKTRKAVIDALHRAYMDHEDFKMTTDLLESLADAAIAALSAREGGDQPAEAGAVAWRHQLNASDDLDGQGNVWFTEDKEHPFGVRGQDFGKDARIISRPLIYGDIPAQPASAGEGLEVLKVAYYAGWDHCLERIRKPSVDAVHEDWVHFSNKLAAPTPPATAQEDGRDAARYRWLRRDLAISAVPRVWASNEGAEPTECLHMNRLDTAIDAAMLTSHDSGKEG